MKKYQHADGMRNQIAFINPRLGKANRTLISASAALPAFILQTGTGPWLQSESDEFKILSAPYLPGRAEALYASTSPVHTLGVVLETYLGSHDLRCEHIREDAPMPYTLPSSEASNPCQAH